MEPGVALEALPFSVEKRAITSATFRSPRRRTRELERAASCASETQRKPSARPSVNWLDVVSHREVEVSQGSSETVEGESTEVGNGVGGVWAAIQVAASDKERVRETPERRDWAKADPKDGRDIKNKYYGAFLVARIRTQ